MPKLTDLERAERELIKAEIASKKACMRRGNLPDGSSRAAITTANARWMCLSEYRDRLLSRFEELGGDCAAALAKAEQ
jgi:hypothetical protein